ncbi:hypothetical protein FACS189413_04520 [Bacteroidia bacterium]|nr:hypothetical protein FACS189413_04520 [Bacteroidia bacterium]
MLYNNKRIASATPDGTNWSVDFSTPLPADDQVQVLVYQTGKTVSYPVTAIISRGTDIQSVIETDPIISMRYYNLQGMEIAHPKNNDIYIVKKIHASQKEKTEKILYLCK